MHVIILDETKEIKYEIKDGTTVTMLDNMIEFRGEQHFNVGDMNKNNSTIVEIEKERPADFTGNKYLWDEGDFVENPVHKKMVERQM